jgi:hypothetical protein
VGPAKVGSKSAGRTGQVRHTDNSSPQDGHQIIREKDSSLSEKESYFPKKGAKPRGSSGKKGSAYAAPSSSAALAPKIEIAEDIRDAIGNF